MACRQQALHRAAAQGAQGFDRKALSGQNRLSYDILKLELEELLKANAFPIGCTGQSVSQPAEFPRSDGFGGSIQPFRTTKDYDDWHTRLSGAPPIIDGMIANMRIGVAKGVTQPKPVMEKVLPQLAALAVDDPEQSVFWGPIRNFPDAVPAADRERLATAFRTLIKDRVARRTSACTTSCATSTSQRPALPPLGRRCPTARPGTRTT